MAAGWRPRPNPRAIHAIYYDLPDPLSAEAEAYIAQARAVLATPPADPRFRAHLAFLFAHSRESLLKKLNLVTQEYVRENDGQLRFMRLLQDAILAIVLVTLVVEALLIFRPMVRRVGEYAAELMRLSNTDPLTGVNNRRGFTAIAEIESRRIQRTGQGACLFMMDIDHFKKVNDTYGHNGGDDVLRALGRAAAGDVPRHRHHRPLRRRGVRRAAAPDRAGAGDGPGERVRAKIEAMRVPTGGREVAFTISIGVAELTEALPSVPDALTRADDGLYKAKAGGRNRVVMA